MSFFPVEMLIIATVNAIIDGNHHTNVRGNEDICSTRLPCVFFQPIEIRRNQSVRSRPGMCTFLDFYYDSRCCHYSTNTMKRQLNN